MAQTNTGAPEAARFSIGIDLGTTNSAIAYADLQADEHAGRVEILGIPQLVEAGEVTSRTLLPSFLYVVGEFDFPAGSLRLPWADDSSPPHIAGELARKRGAESPMRLVSPAGAA